MIDQPPRSFIETARRAQIVSAAIDTIAQVGYARASFARIARRAGISPGLISYHFAAKERLDAQIVADVNTWMDEAIEARAAHADGHRAALRAVIEGFVHYCADHPAHLLAVHEIEAAGAHRADDGARGEPVEDPGLAELVDLLRGGQDNGEFRTDFTPRLMAVTLTGSLEAIPGELYGRPDVDVAAVATQLADTFDRATTACPGREPGERIAENRGTR